MGFFSKDKHSDSSDSKDSKKDSEYNVEEYELTPVSSDETWWENQKHHTIAESETGTGLDENSLQATYDANFNNYRPYVVRRVRLGKKKGSIKFKNLKSPEENYEYVKPVAKPGQTNPVAQGNRGTITTSIDVSPTTEDGKPKQFTILGKPTSVYGLKRDLVVYQKNMRKDHHIFLSYDSFQKFKALKDTKEPANSVVVYTQDKKVVRVPKSELSSLQNYTIDDRKHIIPAEYKASGFGLPLFKVHVPIGIVKSTPFLEFQRYREVPTLPSTNSKEDYETYTYATVRSRYFPYFRRFTFQFFDEHGKPTHRLLAFSNMYRAYTDFNYNGTRFRIIGTSTANFEIELLPSLKLLVLDDDKQSLCDDIIDQKSIRDKLFSSKEGSSKDDDEDYVDTTNRGSKDPAYFANPVPNSNTPAYKTYFADPFRGLKKQGYISDDLPPFGTSQEVGSYGATSIKTNIYANLELYQDSRGVSGDVESTHSVDQDFLVLTTVLSTLRYAGWNAAGVRTTDPRATRKLWWKLE